MRRTEDIFVILSTSFIELVTGLGRHDGNKEHVLLNSNPHHHLTNLTLTLNTRFCHTWCLVEKEDP